MEKQTIKQLLEGLEAKNVLRTEQHGDNIVIFLRNGMKILLKSGTTDKNPVK